MFFAYCSNTSCESPYKLKTDICLKSLEKTKPPWVDLSPLVSMILPDSSVMAPTPWSLLMTSPL